MESVTPFDLSAVLLTWSAAIPRVLPGILKWPPPTLSDLYDVLVALNPIVSHYLLVWAAIFLQCILSILTGSVAWNDRLWSVLPPVWACMYALHPVVSQDRKTGGQFDLRLSMMAFLATTWGLRLSANAFRRGYYAWGHLDYRYIWLRQNTFKNRFLAWGAFIAFFIYGFNTVLLGLITTPLYFAWIRRGEEPQLTPVDILAIVGLTGCIVLETVADQQQWLFQTRKAELLRVHKGDNDAIKLTDPEAAAGFVQSGVFAWSRHPNFFAEVSTWWCFYLFSVGASGRWINWCISGPILYTLLFQMTTPLTEMLSAQKYPLYREYQARVPRLIPWPPRFNTAARSAKEDEKPPSKKTD